MRTEKSSSGVQDVELTRTRTSPASNEDLTVADSGKERRNFNRSWSSKMGFKWLAGLSWRGRIGALIGNSDFKTRAIALVTQRCAVAVAQKVFSYNFDIFTRGWCSPSFKARIEYPKLCQSMTRLVCLRKQTREAIARVGMEGGFWEHRISAKRRLSVLYRRNGGNAGPPFSRNGPEQTRCRRTDLDQQPFGWLCAICEAAP